MNNLPKHVQGDAVVDALLQQYLPRIFLSLEEAGAIFGLSRGQTYNLHARGDFPVGTRRIKGRWKVHLSDLIESLDSARTNNERKGRRRGRPRKLENSIGRQIQK